MLCGDASMWRAQTQEPDHQPIDHRFVPWVGGSCWSKCVTLPHYAILSYTIPVAFPGAVNFQCGLLVLLCAVLRGTSMRPQNSGTVVTWLLRLCPEIGHTQNPKKYQKMQFGSVWWGNFDKHAETTRFLGTLFSALKASWQRWSKM